jgi:hypothetical protein
MYIHNRAYYGNRCDPRADVAAVLSSADVVALAAAEVEPY